MPPISANAIQTPTLGPPAAEDSNSWFMAIPIRSQRAANPRDEPAEVLPAIDTRRALTAALARLRTKRETAEARPHANSPL